MARLKYKITKGMVKNYICKHANDSEIVMFLTTCKYLRLNPFLREIYLVKYSFNDPASIVISKEALLKRAKRNPRYAGHETGILTDEKNNLIGAWAKVYVKGYEKPIYVDVDLEEYIQRKKDGTPTRFWKEKPKTMIKKVALCQALREAFPDELGGVYAAEEIGMSEDELSKDIIDVNDNNKDDQDKQNINPKESSEKTEEDKSGEKLKEELFSEEEGKDEK